MDDPNSINMASILDDPEGFYEKYSKKYGLQATVSYGWACPTCGMVNSPTRAICINSYAIQNGTSVEWKHY